MLEESKMDYEKDICCPSSVAPSEEAIKDEDCKNCLIRSSCCYLNSDAPKSKKSSLCNKVMESYLKTLRAEVELERKQQRITTEDFVAKYMRKIDENKGLVEKDSNPGKPIDLSPEGIKLTVDSFDEIIDSDLYDRVIENENSEKKLHDLMHQETDVEADRQYVRVKAKKNTDNN